MVRKICLCFHEWCECYMITKHILIELRASSLERINNLAKELIVELFLDSNGWGHYRPWQQVYYFYFTKKINFQIVY